MNQSVPGWTMRPAPGYQPIEGRYVRVEPIVDRTRFRELFDAFAADGTGALWRWLAYGPFAGFEAFAAFAERTYLADDILFHAIVPHRSGVAEGVAALMRTDRANGVTEVGHICFGPSLQGSREASEAIFLLMARVFDELGYRRFEWKCNNGNAASKRAAERFGFSYEGLFRQHMVVKGENRDTAWFSIIDTEWPGIKAGFEAWLQPSSFDAEGRQLRKLADCR